MHRSLIRLTFALLIPALAMLPATGRAQEAVARYFETPAVYNPAASGASGMLDLRGAARIDKTTGNLYLFSADMPLPVGTGNFGVGLTASRDSGDPLRTTVAALRGSFSQPMLGGRMWGGFGVGYLDRHYDYAADETPSVAKLKASTVDIAGGLYFVHPRLWGGISLAHANAPELDFGSLPAPVADDDDQSASPDNSNHIRLRLPRTVYAMAGTDLRLNRTVELLPSAMLGSGGGATWVDLTGRVRFRGLITVGASWRNARSASLLASLNYKGAFIGYAYGYPLSAAVRAHSHGFHEIMAGYSLRLTSDRKPGTRHKSIRIM